jgi:hypothetical protein
MGSGFVVVLPPGFDGLAGLALAQAPKPIFVQAFISHLAIETLNESILDRLSGLDEM